MLNISTLNMHKYINNVCTELILLFLSESLDIKVRHSRCLKVYARIFLIVRFPKGISSFYLQYELKGEK